MNITIPRQRNFHYAVIGQTFAFFAAMNGAIAQPKHLGMSIDRTEISPVAFGFGTDRPAAQFSLCDALWFARGQVLLRPRKK